jgi:hypothetical protein
MSFHSLQLIQEVGDEGIKVRNQLNKECKLQSE